MKTVSQNSYGGPEVLNLENVNPPVAKGRDLLVRVQAVAVTAADTQFRQGKPLPARFLTGLFRPNHLVLGGFFSGVIHAIGPDVKRFEVGDAIYGATPNFLGATAEFIALPEEGALVRRPDSLAPEGAATLAYSFTSAMPMLRDSAKVKRGDRVLIIGASGSVGLAAVQIAKYFGAHVTGMCSQDKEITVRSVGANETLDYKKVDLAKLPPVFDVILDASGKVGFGQSQSALKKGGVFVAALPSLALLLQTLPQFGRKRLRLPMTALRPKKDLLAELNLLADLSISKQIRPLIARRFRIEETRDAHRFVESGQKSGDVVVELA